MNGGGKPTNNGASKKRINIGQKIMNWISKYYSLIFAAIGAFLIYVSFNYDLVPPDPALTAWVEWAAKYVALVVAAQKVWQVSDVAIRGWARRLGV